MGRWLASGGWGEVGSSASSCILRLGCFGGSFTGMLRLLRGMAKERHKWVFFLLQSDLLEILLSLSPTNLMLVLILP